MYKDNYGYEYKCALCSGAFGPKGPDISKDTYFVNSAGSYNKADEEICEKRRANNKKTDLIGPRRIYKNRCKNK